MPNDTRDQQTVLSESNGCHSLSANDIPWWIHDILIPPPFFVSSFQNHFYLLFGSSLLSSWRKRNPCICVFFQRFSKFSTLSIFWIFDLAYVVQLLLRFIITYIHTYILLFIFRVYIILLWMYEIRSQSTFCSIFLLVFVYDLGFFLGSEIIWLINLLFFNLFDYWSFKSRIRKKPIKETGKVKRED